MDLILRHESGMQHIKMIDVQQNYCEDAHLIVFFYIECVGLAVKKQNNLHRTCQVNYRVLLDAAIL